MGSTKLAREQASGSKLVAVIRMVALKVKGMLEPKSGLEPETCRLRIDCSTN
jgi:hypothetical protein